MKILLLGAGKIGSALLESLIKEGHEVFVVDKREEIVNEIVNKYDANGMIGDGLSKETLFEADIENTDILIACTTSDETNVLCAVLGKKLGAKHAIVRVRDPKCFTEISNLKDELGIDLVFNPELRTATDIASVLKFPSAKTVEKFGHGKAYMVGFEILKGNPIIGKSIIEISKEYLGKFLFGAVIRNGKVIIPRGDFTFKEDDIAYIIATEQDLITFSRKIKIFKPRTKSVFIIGGGKTAYYLAKELSSNGVFVKIIEKNRERCEFLSENLDGVQIVWGDGTSHKVLEEAGIKNCDAVVALTGSDEENVIISLFANMCEISKVVTKVVRQSVIEMINFLDLDSVVSPRFSVANQVIKYARSTEYNDQIKTFYKLNDSVEALEFTVDEEFSKIGVALKDMKIIRDTLIGGIIRNHEFVLPVGDTKLQLNDRVVVVSTAKGLSELNDILR